MISRTIKKQVLFKGTIQISSKTFSSFVNSLRSLLYLTPGRPNGYESKRTFL